MAAIATSPAPFLERVFQDRGGWIRYVCGGGYNGEAGGGGGGWIRCEGPRRVMGNVVVESERLLCSSLSGWYLLSLLVAFSVFPSFGDILLVSLL